MITSYISMGSIISSISEPLLVSGLLGERFLHHLMGNVFLFEFTMETQRAIFHKRTAQLSLFGYVEKA